MSAADVTGPRSWNDEEARLRRGICEVGRMCYDKGLIDAAAGNISARQADGTILITPAGAMKGCMAPEHISHMDADGRLLGNSQRASTETG
ncbi:MAG: class II aldolase/adducin family protein, partial [Planctomycetota bacterium]|nr:class II aldolase/adducin family protein [Planctomycetota bacterium]